MDATSSVYNGANQTKTTAVTMAGTLVEGHTFKDDVTATATGKNVGEYELTFGAVTVSNFNNVESGKTLDYYYNISYEAGTFEITKRPLTIKPNDDTKSYDGTALSSSSIEIVGTGLAASENFYTADTRFTGSQTDVGTTASSISAFTITADGNAGTSLNANYAVTKQAGTLEVTINTTDLGVYAEEGTATYNGATHKLADSYGTLKGTKDTGATVLYSTAENGTYTTTEPEFTDAGAHSVWVKAEKANYQTTAAIEKTVDIAKRPITVKPEDGYKVYDEVALVPTKAAVINGSIPAVDQIGSVSFTGSIEDVGTATSSISAITINRISPAKDVTSNYEITKAEGNLQVVSASGLGVTPEGTTVKYDGKPHGLTGVETKIGTNDTTATILYSTDYNTEDATGTWSTTAPEFTDAGTYQVWVMAKKANYDDSGVVTSNVIVNKRDITVTPGDESKTYDGKALKAGSFTIGGDKLVDGQIMTASYGGSITDKGTANATISSYTIKDGSADVAGNYNVTKNTGTLKVNAREVSLRPESAEKQYDGKALTVSKVEITKGTMASGEKATATLSGNSRTQVGENKISIKSINVSGGKATNYDFTQGTGTITITEDPNGNDNNNNNDGGGQTLTTPEPEVTPPNNDPTGNGGNDNDGDSQLNTTIGDNPSVSIGGTDVPLWGSRDFPSWSLLSLVLTVGAIFMMLMSLVPVAMRKREEDRLVAEGHERSPIVNAGWLAAGAIITAIELAVFPLTQRISATMVVMDAWTFAHIAATVLIALCIMKALKVSSTTKAILS